MYKIILIFLFIIGELFSAPSWFGNHDFNSHDQVYYGYGQGVTLKEARTQAMGEII